jgi:uncharacterized membrane protein
MFRQLRGYFISGLVILAPLFFTVLVLYHLVRMADAFIVNPVFQLIPGEFDALSRTVLAKIAIAAAVIIFVTLLGLTAHRFLFRRMLIGFEAMLESIPVFNRLYRSFKDIAKAIFGGKQGIFKRVVLIQYPAPGIYAMGFVTNESFTAFPGRESEELLSVFIPSPPNPAAGFSFLLPKKDVIETDISVEEGLKYCISCGVHTPVKKK